MGVGVGVGDGEVLCLDVAASHLPFPLSSSFALAACQTVNLCDPLAPTHDRYSKHLII